MLVRDKALTVMLYTKIKLVKKHYIEKYEWKTKGKSSTTIISTVQLNT